MVRILSPGHPGKQNFRRSGGFLPPIYHIPEDFPTKTAGECGIDKRAARF
jgi:hypothetical protein